MSNAAFDSDFWMMFVMSSVLGALIGNFMLLMFWNLKKSCKCSQKDSDLQIKSSWHKEKDPPNDPPNANSNELDELVMAAKDRVKDVGKLDADCLSEESANEQDEKPKNESELKDSENMRKDCEDSGLSGQSEDQDANSRSRTISQMSDNPELKDSHPPICYPNNAETDDAETDVPHASDERNFAQQEKGKQNFSMNIAKVGMHCASQPLFYLPQDASPSAAGQGEPKAEANTNIHYNIVHSENVFISPRQSIDMVIVERPVVTENDGNCDDKKNKFLKASNSERNEQVGGSSPDGSTDKREYETPPAYETVMRGNKEASADGCVEEREEKPSANDHFEEREQTTLVMELVLNGYTYSLETVSADEAREEGCEIIPDEVHDLVSEICAEENVTSAMLYPSLSKEKELLVVGVGADEGVQDKLKHKMKQYFPEFTITTNNIKNYTDHTRPYAKSLMAVKELSRENKTYRVVSEATCELILEATDPTHGGNIPRLYALVSAHFVLDEPEQELLKQSDVHENADQHVRQTTTGKNLDSLYSLSLLMPRKYLPVSAHDVIFSYRPYPRPEDGDPGPSHFSSFYGDACLLQIDEAYMNLGKGKIISQEELLSAMQERPDQKKIGDILPVTDAKQIIGMATKKVKIEVGPSSGYMIIPGRALKSKKAETSKPQLHHIQFVIMDWNLLQGHSGSIIYVVDAKTQLRHRLGVLFGECNRQTDQKVFQAIVLHQAITELETRYGDKVRDLKPMGEDVQALGTKDAAAIRSRLVKHSEPSKDLSKREHLERKSEVRHAMNSTAISDDTSFSSKKDESLSLDSDMNSLSSSLNPKFDPSNSPSPIQKVTTGYQSPDVSGYYTGASNSPMNTDDE